MIRVVNKNRTKDNLVLGSIYVDMNNIVISPEEIMFLKMDNNILKNKYVNGYERLYYPNCGNMKKDNSHYKMIYKKDIPYLHFDGHRDFSIYLKYYTTLNNKTICYSDSAIINRINEEIIDMSYDGVKEIFNPSNYDGMYIMDFSGNILSAYNKKDGIVVNNELDLETKKDNKMIYGTNDRLYEGYNNIIITVSNNKFEINLFKLESIDSNNYRLYISNIKNNRVNNEYIDNISKVDDFSKKEFENNKVYKKAI